MFTKIFIVATAVIYQAFAIPVITTNETNSYPYLASVENKGLLACGAVILKSDVVLSTAHCVEEFLINDLVVRVGSLIREDKKGAHIQTRKVKNVVIHPNFNGKGDLDNNVAVIYLDQSFQLNEFVNVIDLAIDEYTSGQIITLGWGKNGNFEEPDNLIISKTSLISNSDCNKIYLSKKQTISESSICGFTSKDQVLCQNVGSPMVIHYPEDPKNDKLIGLASHSEIKRVYNNHLKGGPAILVRKTCDTSVPQIFTKITAVSQWILSKF